MVECPGCFAHLSNTIAGSEKITLRIFNPLTTSLKLLIISNDGASGVYPGCTGLAYIQAVNDHTDYIDCPVQVTQDGSLICLSSINLMDCTTVATSPFGTRTSSFPDIQSGLGIYTFNLTLEEIQKNLKHTVVEVNNYFQGASVDGIISDFPATASAYKRNTCLRNTDMPVYMLLVQPGGLLSLMSQSALPPAQPPFPPLKDSDVVEPPLPSASTKPLNPTGASPASGTPASSGQPRAVLSILSWAMLFGYFLLLPLTTDVVLHLHYIVHLFGSM